MPRAASTQNTRNAPLRPADASRAANSHEEVTSHQANRLARRASVVSVFDLVAALRRAPVEATDDLLLTRCHPAGLGACCVDGQAGRSRLERIENQEATHGR